MRRREGGAGRGTRERGQRKATSPGGGGEPSRGTKTAGRSDRSVEGVSRSYRVARRTARRIGTNASDPQATGHPGAIREDLRVIQITRRFGAPFPSFGGEGKQKGLRANPAPSKEQGPRSFCRLKLNMRALSPFAPAKAGAQNREARLCGSWVSACAGTNGAGGPPTAGKARAYAGFLPAVTLLSRAPSSKRVRCA